MIVAHILGIPIEESVLQLAPAGAAIVTAFAIAGRTGLGSLRRQLRRRDAEETTGGGRSACAVPGRPVDPDQEGLPVDRPRVGNNLLVHEVADMTINPNGDMTIHTTT